MSARLFTIDSFTSKPFAGNPAGICILEKPADENWMQSLATELNLSETAFVHSEKTGFRIRFFTPAGETQISGHATLAAAHVLWNELGETRASLSFNSLAGPLYAGRTDTLIDLDFPPEPIEPLKIPVELLNSLGGVSAIFSGKTPSRFFIEVKSDEVLRGIKPFFSALKSIDPGKVIVTAASSNPDYDFVSRYFAPSAGINEDSVTGYAHSALGLYWSKKLNKNRLTGFQASSRGGEIAVSVDGERVKVSGRAVTITRGEVAV